VSGIIRRLSQIEKQYPVQRNKKRERQITFGAISSSQHKKYYIVRKKERAEEDVP
jgi:hypothetical protein